MTDPFAFFDAIYCISLPDRQVAWRKLAAALELLDLADRVERFDAVDTRALGNHHVGCALSHRAVVQEAAARGLGNVLVLEEDALFHEETKRFLARSVGELARLEWDVLHLGGHRWGQTFRAAPGCRWLEISDGLTCTHAVAYNAAVFGYLLASIPDEPAAVLEWCGRYAAIDQWLVHQLQWDGARADGFREGRCFVTAPSLASQAALLDQETDPDRFMRFDARPIGARSTRASLPLASR